MGGSVTCLHFNHRLRGEASEEDARFCEALCSELGLELNLGSWNRAESSAQERVSEDQARQARMEFFLTEMGKASGQHLILTGHHADDVGETMLMRLSRGSGLQGLTAPRAYSEGSDGLRFARPLLGLRKATLIDCLRQVGADWREDASNETEDYYRNRLRLKVMPEWERASDRPLAERLSQSRALLEEDWRALEAVFEDRWPALLLQDDASRLSWERVAAQPRAFQRRALTRLLNESGVPVLAFAAFESVLERIRINSSFRASVEDGVWICGDPERGVMHIERKRATAVWDLCRLPVGARLNLPDEGQLESRIVAIGEPLRKRVLGGEISHGERVLLDLGAQQSAETWVRTWQEGDAYRPLGRKSQVKLKELFGVRKIPREARRTLPIVVDGEGRVLWVPGLPPSDDRRIRPETSRALQLTYRI